MRKPCPTPKKKAFRDRIGAALHAAQVADGWRRKRGSTDNTGTNTQEPYECPCGRWHTRTVSKRQERRGR